MPKTESRTRQVFLNTISGLGGFAGTALIGIALTPFLIGRLGFEGYGFWIVLSTAVTYVGLMDLGIESTFLKFIAEYASTQAWDRVRQVITFGVLFYTALSLVFAPIAFAIAPIVIHWMKVSPRLAVAGPLMFACITLTFFLQSAAGVVGSLLGGVGYLRLVSLTTFVSRIVFAIAAVAFVAFGMGIYGLIAATALQIAVSAAMFYVLARRMVGGVFINPLRLEWPIVKKLFKLGGWIQVTNLASTITMETNRLIIAIFVQTASVTTYEIANKLTRTMRSVPFSFVVALLPAVSALDALEGREAFNAHYVRASRYLNLVTLLLVGFVIAAAEPIARLWLGRTYPEIPVAVALLGFSFIAINLTAIGTCMLRAIGEPKYEAFYFVCFAVASIAGMLLLVPSLKLNGVLIGMLAGALVSSAYFLWVFHGLRKLSAWSGFFAWFLKLAPAAAISMSGAYAVARALNGAFFATRAGAGVETVVLVAVFTCLYAGSLIAFKFFDASDLAMLRRIAPGRMQRFLGRHENVGATA